MTRRRWWERQYWRNVCLIWSHEHLFLVSCNRHPGTRKQPRGSRFVYGWHYRRIDGPIWSHQWSKSRGGKWYRKLTLGCRFPPNCLGVKLYTNGIWQLKVAPFCQAQYSCTLDQSFEWILAWHGLRISSSWFPELWILRWYGTSFMYWTTKCVLKSTRFFDFTLFCHSWLIISGMTTFRLVWFPWSCGSSLHGATRR